ncbi:MAG: chemotaxis protein [Alphaproteobacteria bacterium]|nr:chemotaxis protein [Alphaproteobacteria bacterium]
MPERILALSKALSETATKKVDEIKMVTKSTKMLALNAQIEATRAGEAGRGFSVVAQEVKVISEHIAKISDELTEKLGGQTNDLSELGQRLIAQVRGRRLTDLSLNMIEIIDRNLYERSCDVRWWATDSAVVDCCSNPTEDARAFASKRLGVILNAYTVYLDLWVADLSGKVIANGRPNKYTRVQGSSVAQEDWFKRAIHTATGDDYVVTDVDTSGLLDGSAVSTYAAAIRDGGETNGKVIGALGIFFDWEAQSQTVVDSVRLEADEKSRTRCLLLDSHFRIIAASDHKGVLSETVPISTEGQKAGNYVDSQGRTVGFSLTPGYETYEGLGWYGAIIQEKLS